MKGRINARLYIISVEWLSKNTSKKYTSKAKNTASIAIVKPKTVNKNTRRERTRRSDWSCEIARVIPRQWYNQQDAPTNNSGKPILNVSNSESLREYGVLKE
jgi:hypothetical protein